MLLACCSLGANVHLTIAGGGKREKVDFGGETHILVTASFCCHCSRRRGCHMSSAKPRWTLIRPRGLQDGTQSPEEWPAPQETLVEQASPSSLPSPRLSILGPDAWVGTPVCLNESTSPSLGEGGRSFQLRLKPTSLSLSSRRQ